MYARIFQRNVDLRLVGMLNGLCFWRRSADSVIDYKGILFPLSVLQVLLAQSASAEVRRRFEGKGNVFDTIRVSREFQQAFIGSYVQANLNYFEAIRPHMPTDCRRVLDIGCGIGLLDLLIYRNAAGRKPELYLFDRSVELSKLSTSGIAPTGFNDRYVFTASLKLAASFLKLNGVAGCDIRLCEVGAWNIRQGAPFDLVFSRKSWGFHYPLSEYLEEVVSSLADKGIVITDVRGNQDGEDLMRQRFADTEVLQQGSKSALMIARSPKVLS